MSSIITKRKIKQVLNQQEDAVHVVTARQVTNELKSLIENKFGKDLKYIYQTDPELLGGIVIRYKDKLYDNSIKSKLQSLVKSIV